MTDHLTVPPQHIADPYTRDDLDLTGGWRLTTEYVLYEGLPAAENPPPDGVDQAYSVVLERTPDKVSPLADDPVYTGNLIYFDAKGGPRPNGELIVTPFVSPRGILLTMWPVGNKETATDGYTTVYGARAVNDRLRPIDGTGTWTDSDGSTGRVTGFHRTDIVFGA